MSNEVWRDESGDRHASGSDAGPAGIAPLVLGGGEVRLAVDYDDPQVLVDLSAGPGPVGRRALEVLLGPAAARVLSGAGDERHQVLGIGRAPVLGRLGPLAVLAADLEERPLDDLALGLGLVELAVGVADLVQRADLGLVLDPAALADHGLGLLVEHARALPGRIPAHRTAPVESLLARARAVDPRGGRRVDEVRRWLSDPPAAAGGARFAARGRPTPPPAAVLAAMPASADAAAAPPAPPRAASIDDAPPPLALPVHFDATAPADLVSARRTGHEVSVAVTGDAPPGGWWLRVTRVDALPTVLGLVPFASDRFGPLVARALLDPDEPASDLVLDVTAAPDGPPDPRRLRTVRDAATFGRIAARHERAGRTDAASAAWLRCVQGWEAAGDVRRAELALVRSRATGPGRGRSPATVIGRPGPGYGGGFLVDEVG